MGYLSMSKGKPSLSNELKQLGNQAYFEFCNVADYVWKNPRFIENEINIEKEKLGLYFSDNKKMAKLRWQRESRNLTRVFPYLMAVGNLFSAASLFESYILLLCEVLDRHHGVPVNTVRGNGTARLFEHLKAHGLAPSSIPLSDQIQAGIKIRNCLVHAMGVLSRSRDDKELRRVVSSGTYLSREDRERRKKLGVISDKILVVGTPHGDRIQISNDYCFILVSYFRDYFVDVCSEASKKRKKAPKKRVPVI